MNLESAFGRALKEHRKKLSLTQESLAHTCGLHRTFIGLLEQGKRNPSLKTIYMLSKSLGVTPDVLVRETERILTESKEK